MAERVSFPGDDILNTGKAGPVDNFCVSDKVMPAYPEDHTLGTHVEDLELTSVDLPAEVSMSPNRRPTTKWIVYKSGTSEVLSAVEAGSVARLCS